MLKRTIIFIFGLALLVVCIGGIFMAIIKNKSPDIEPFEVSEYQYYIDNFSSEDNLGKISNSKDLIEKVEAIWIEKYGEQIKNQKPYQVFYDEENGIWLVQGTLRFNMTGGVANILVDNDTGKVLAIWHDK
ncbi:MAG: hypothetical protein IJW03_04425 [Clostridia bacterium]|nr:hypothetical protein [Clostridia bacterium]